MLSPKRGMGPVWLQDGSLDKCSERHADACNPILTDHCCAVIACVYCLKWKVYGELDEIGIATFDPDTGRWVGTIIGLEFIAYWDNQYGVCYFIVELDGVQIAKLECGLTECRDSSSSVDMTINYEHGELSWTKQETHKLPYVANEHGCMDFFCGNCECVCKELCAILKIPLGDGYQFGARQFFEGEDELGLSSYTDCDPPEWFGSVPVTFGALSKDISVFVYMYRDPLTGDCYISGEAHEQELTPTKIGNCKQIDVTFTLYDGSIVRIKCKDCGCGTTEYCQYCCLPMDFSNPLFPGGVIKDIPFSYTGCGGGSGVFHPFPGDVPCSTEVFFVNTFMISGAMFGTAYPFDIPFNGICPPTPCTNSVSFMLECTAKYEEPGDDIQCSRLWLWIGSLLKQIGDLGETPPGNPPTGYSWRRVQASNCTCDPIGGIAASIAWGITVDCSHAIVGVNGACAYLLIDCCDLSCGGTLSL